MSRSPPPRTDDEIRESLRRVFVLSEQGLRAMLRHRLADGHEVDDCLQGVMVKLLEKGASVNPTTMRAWLFRVAANEAALMWRQKQAMRRALEGHATQQPLCGRAGTAGEPGDLDSAERKAAVWSAVARLPDEQAEIVKLRIEDGMSFAAIAAELAIPIGTALTRMRRALERLRHDPLLRDSFDDQPFSAF